MSWQLESAHPSGSPALRQSFENCRVAAVVNTLHGRLLSNWIARKHNPSRHDLCAVHGNFPTARRSVRVGNSYFLTSPYGWFKRGDVDAAAQR
jgi:hypothetical protein